MNYIVLIATLLVSGRVWCAASSFSQQAARFINSIKMPDQELAAVPHILRDLERTLRTKWPGCQVEPFGSVVTGLALIGSDIDAYVLLPDHSIKQNGSINFKAVPVLKRSPDYTKIHPSRLYVTFKHVPSHTKIDLLFNNIEGGRNSHLLRYILSIDERVLSLALIVKYWWATTQKMAGYRMISNYGMHVMVVFYLQQVGMLPPITMLQNNATPFLNEGWNSGFNEIHYRPSNNETLYQLLGGFFEFYNDFDYRKYIISPFVGHAIERRLFRNLSSVPDEFECYKRNVGEHREEPANLHCPVFVQDFILHNKNVAVSMRRRRGSPFQTEFQRLALKYRENNENTFLDEILSVQIN